MYKSLLSSILSLGLAIHCFAVGTAIPSLDQMAGDWVPMAQVDNPPDVHNFNEMLIVGRDLTSFYCNPGGLFTHTHDPKVQWVAGYPLVKMALNGIEYPTLETRWYAYRALRRNSNCAGLSVETDTRMVNEQRGILCRILLANRGTIPREVQLDLHVPGRLDATGPGVINTTQTARATSFIQPTRKPDQIAATGNNVVWHWKLDVPPGGTIRLGFVAGDEIDAKAAETRQKVAYWAAHFDPLMVAFKQTWGDRWAEAFTPGNPHFSGNLPALESADAALCRNYYMGALTMLTLERTQFPIPRSFITSGERADGIQYYWDASMQSTAWALLEPAGMKAVLRRWLVQNPRGSPIMSLRDTHGYDMKHYTAISGYALNAANIFKATDQYMRVTGDKAFLDEKLENGKTVLECLDALATDWETLQKGPNGLADYGGNGRLLETAPAYVECVASVNAQNVWMMREAAEWEALKGNAPRAKELRNSATAFLPAVLSLYNAGTGAWNAYRVNGTLVPVQHCVDYIYVADALSNDLTAAQKLGMNNFVKRELLTRDWMRAMSWKDPAAARAFRPDHSPTGAYDGWIPLTIAAMWNLGEPQDAYAFYRRAADVTTEGPFAQAHEFYGPTPNANQAPVRIAMRGSNMKECISGVAFADVVINTFFGYLPSVDGTKLLLDPKRPRPFSGSLLNVRHGKTFYSISADSAGLKMAQTAPAPIVVR